MHHFNLGAGFEWFTDGSQQSIDVQCVYFPMYKVIDNWNSEGRANPNFHYHNSATQICRVKFRGVGKENKKYMRQHPVGGQPGLFGLNLVKN